MTKQINIYTELFEKILTQWQNKLIFIQIGKIIILKHEYKFFWQEVSNRGRFLGMIHVISFNSTGVGVYTIQQVLQERTLKQSWILFSIFFKQKLHGIIWALLLPSQHFVHRITWMEHLTLTSTAQQSIPLLWFFAWLRACWAE